MSYTEQPSTALRPLGSPRAVEVQLDADGLPLAIARRRRGQRPDWQRVEQVDDAWRVAEEWWRDEPHERTYVRLILEGGRPLTLFHDGHAGGWFEQPYAPGAGSPGAGGASARSNQRMRT